MIGRYKWTLVVSEGARINRGGGEVYKVTSWAILERPNLQLFRKEGQIFGNQSMINLSITIGQKLKE